MKNKICKRHRWRVGSGVGEMIGKKLIETKLNLWCERCDKKMIAYNHPRDWFKLTALFNDDIICAKKYITAKGMRKKSFIWKKKTTARAK